MESVQDYMNDVVFEADEIEVEIHDCGANALKMAKEDDVCGWNG